MTLPGWLAKQYPFEPRRFDTGRGTMSYLDEGGSDEAVVMVHGNPTWSFFYRNVVLRLRGRMRCIVPDHLGCGLSDKPASFDYTLSEHIRNLSALLDSLGLRRIHLVVHDWGGAIGLGAALSHADRLGRVVVLNTAAFADKRIPLRIRICRLPVVGEVIVRGFNGFAAPAARMAVVRPLDSETKAGFLFPYGNWADRIAVHRFVRDIPTAGVSPSGRALAAVEARLGVLRERDVRILWGGGDFCFNRHFYERWLQLVPAAEATWFASAGHYVLEDAREECLSAIERHLVRAG